MLPLPRPGSPRSALLIVAAIALLAPRGAPAQGLPRLFDAAWMGFDTGVFGEAFGPTSVAAGDMDGDGDLDLVVGQSYYGWPGVSLLLNLGDGTFARPAHSRLAYDQGVAEVALLDVDQDGDLDVVGTIPDGNGLSRLLGLWRNDGTGALGPAQMFATGPGPIGIAVADFDGDGFPDVATADRGYMGQGATVSLLVHNRASGAAAGFLAPRPFPVAPGPTRLAAGDVDGDGKVDLVVAGGDSLNDHLEVLGNDGSGGFTLLGSYPVGGPGQPVVGLADLDRDGDLDLVSSFAGAAGSTSYGVIEVRRNAGGGSFGPSETHRLDDWSAPAAALAVGDLDGDGSADIVSANPSGRAFEGFRVLRGDGALGFLPPESYPSSQNTEAILVADLDRDGDLDVATVAWFSAAVTVHRNPGGGLFPLPRTYSLGSGTEAMDAADLDGDGDLDIVATDDGVQVLLNRGDGSFPPARRYAPPLNPADVKLRDLNGDGFPDLLLGPDAEYPPYNFATALNRGDGTFAPGRVWAVNSCGQGHIDAFDLDQDGDLDVVLTEEEGCAGGAPAHIYLFRNDGQGVLSPVAPLRAYTFAVGIAAADLDRDGHLDLVTMEGGYGPGFFHGNGDLTFQPEVLSGTPGSRWTLVDLDQDGNLDAAITVPADSFGTDQVGVCLGRGDGTFAPATLYSGSSVLEALTIAVDIDAGDANCDGLPDLMVTNYASNDIGLFISRGDGTLEPQVRYGPGLVPLVSLAGDFTGDGRLDLASAVWEGPFCCGTAVALLPGLCGCAVPDTVPPDQGNVLRAVRRGIDVELSWAGATAGRWRLYRDRTKQSLGGTALAPDVSAPAWLDAGAVQGWPLWFYRLRGLSPCTSTPGP